MRHGKIPKEATGGREEAGRLRPGVVQHAEWGASSKAYRQEAREGLSPAVD